MYKSGEEYNIKYYNKEGKEQTCTITPEEDMNRPQMIKKLKEENKDFLKLIECKLMEGDSEMEYKTYKDLIEDGRAADVCDDVYDIWVYVDYDPDSEDYFDLCLEQICSELEIKDADMDYTTVTCNVTDWVKKHLNKLEEIFAIDAPDEDAKVEEFVCEMFEGLVSGNGTDKAYEQLYYALIDAPIPYTKQPEVKPENIQDHSIKKEEKFMQFATEEEKDEYIKDHNLEKDIDYKDKGINAIELLNESNEVEDPMEELTETLVEEIVEEANEEKEEVVGEEIVETISKERKAEIIAELYDWIDYHALEACDFLNLDEEELEKSAKLELDEERMDTIISEGIACVIDHVDGKEEERIAFQDVIGLNDKECEILNIELNEEIIEEAKKDVTDLSLNIKPWYHETYPTDDIYTELRDEVTFQDVQNALDKGEDVYEVFGVGDSIVRERVFEKLSELRNVEYDVVYNEWLHGDKVDEDEMEALKQAYNTLMNSKKEESKLVEDETSEEDLQEFAEEVEEAIEEVGPTDESEELAVNVINDSVDVLEVDERMAINGYEDFLNAAKELLAPALYEVLEKEVKEIITDEEDHITILENIKATFHLDSIEIPGLPQEEIIEEPTEEVVEEPVEDEEEIVEESKSLVTLNDVLDELEADIDSPMAQEEGPMIEEFIKDHPELTAVQVAKAYRNYEETGSFEYIEDSEEE